MNGSNGQRLSRHDLMRRYGVSAQQINGWLPGPSTLARPSTVISGQPYWTIFITIFTLVRWEAEVRARARQKYRNLQVAAGVAPPSHC